MEKLKEVMKEKNISIRKLAIASNIASSDLNCAINGKKPFYPNWRKRVAAALGCDERMLFPEYEEANNKADK